jgi:hypothetical protein
MDRYPNIPNYVSSNNNNVANMQLQRIHIPLLGNRVPEVEMLEKEIYKTPDMGELRYDR